MESLGHCVIELLGYWVIRYLLRTPNVSNHLLGHCVVGLLGNWVIRLLRSLFLALTPSQLTLATRHSSLS